MLGKISLTLAIVSLPVCAWAVEVTRNVEVKATADKVWEVIGPFCSIGEWFPGFKSCTEEIRNGSTYRKLVAIDGSQFLEKRMEGTSDTAYRYAIIEGPLPVKDYVSTFEVKDEGEKSMIVWSSKFAADGASDEKAAEIIGDIYQKGLDALRDKFAK